MDLGTHRGDSKGSMKQNAQGTALAQHRQLYHRSALDTWLVSQSGVLWDMGDCEGQFQHLLTRGPQVGQRFISQVSTPRGRGICHLREEVPSETNPVPMARAPRLGFQEATRSHPKLRTLPTAGSRVTLTQDS